MYVLSIRAVSDSVTTLADGSTSKLKGKTEFKFALKAEDITAEGDTIMSVEPQRAIFPWFYGKINNAFEQTTFKMKLTPTGHINGFIGTDEMRQAVRKSLEATPGESKVDGYMKIISDEALISLMQPVLAVWPNVPVAAGDEWTRDDIYNPLGDTLERTTFKIDSMEGGIATISTATEFTPAGKDANTKLSGKSTGEVRVLTSDGTIRAYRSSQRLEGTALNPTLGTNDSFVNTTEIQAELTAR